MPALFTPEELALASPSEGAAPEVAEAPAPKRKKQDGDGYGRGLLDPSPEEIRRLCLESIQPGWSVREERKRAGREEWTPPERRVSAAR